MPTVYSITLIPCSSPLDSPGASSRSMVLPPFGRTDWTPAPPPRRASMPRRRSPPSASPECSPHRLALEVGTGDVVPEQVVVESEQTSRDRARWRTFHRRPLGCQGLSSIRAAADRRGTGPEDRTRGNQTLATRRDARAAGAIHLRRDQAAACMV